MTSRMTVRRIRIVVSSVVLLVPLAFGQLASAQSVLPFEPKTELEQIEGAESTVTVTFEGNVYEPDGAPADEAVVVSSAGGQAVTDSSGSFRLEVDVPVGVESVQLTASGRSSEQLVPSRSITVVEAFEDSWVGTLQLAQSTSCSPRWLPTFGGLPGTSGGIDAFAVYDDGSGEALYAGGYFDVAGGVSTTAIARWDGSKWSALGGGMDHWVNALVAFDDGTGPALYAGGSFTSAGGATVNGIAKWDGSTWSSLGNGVNLGTAFTTRVRDLVVFDDGTGAALYAGGAFTKADGKAANRVAKWDGTNWSPLGSGTDGGIEALEVFDDGQGAALYAAGNFTSAGGAVASSIARWDGTSWAPLGAGVNSTVRDLTVFDDGNGFALYAAGQFTSAGGAPASRVARWDGSSWAPLGSGIDDLVWTLSVHDVGGAPSLIAGGDFTVAGGVSASRVAKWDGSQWSALGAGFDSDVHAFATFDRGGGPDLHAGGHFVVPGGGASVSGYGNATASGIARWDGAQWTTISSGLPTRVFDLVEYDDGGGSALYVGGYFSEIGGVPLGFIGKWNGSSWAPVGGGSGSLVSELEVYDDGHGEELYASGWFTAPGGSSASNLARWDGLSWSPLVGGAGTHTYPSYVRALTTHDDGHGERLYAGGTFVTATGDLETLVGRWDGVNWSILGSGFSGQPPPIVFSLGAFDDGSGEALYVGGRFDSAVGAATGHIAKWDGSSWVTVGGGLDDSVMAMAVYDDGTGPALYAGGYFDSNGGGGPSYIAKWDGTQWTALGGGVNAPVMSLYVFDDGTGAKLYAGGWFSIAGGLAASSVASWNGSSWSAMGSGMTPHVAAFATYDDGGGPALYAGGWFTLAPDSGDAFLAKWGCDVPGVVSNYCTAGTSGSGCTPTLVGTGVASASSPTGFTVSAMAVEGTVEGMFYFGVNGRQANPWGNGTSYQCVVPPVQRAGLLPATGSSGACDGAFAQDLNVFWSSNPSKTPGAGRSVQVQLWYLDPFNTSNVTGSLSDAMEFTVAP